MSVALTNQPSHWTAEEQALLEANDRPIEEVARLLGKPAETIKHRRHWFGLYGAPSDASAGLPWMREERVTRACLHCGRPFETTRYVRVCAPCKKSEDWS